MELLLWFLFDCVLEMVGEVILGLTQLLNEDQEAPRSRSPRRNAIDGPLPCARP
jgi:hypothetical protein